MSDETQTHPQDSGNPPVVSAGDPAGKSLSDALRVSFVLLTVIMVLMVIGFLLSGIKSVKNNQIGIVKSFGRKIRTVKSGLTYTWPWPIGQIELVDAAKQTLTLTDFWLHETATDKSRSLEQRRVRGEGLRPGWDGALLTGDRGLIHLKIVCTFEITDAAAFRQQVGWQFAEVSGGVDAERESAAIREIIRSAVCSAAIRSAATRTTERLQRGEGTFDVVVQERANEALRQMKTGLEVTKLEASSATRPLGARRAYTVAQSANKQAQERVSRARTEAEVVLQNTAGEAYKMLVGRPWSAGDAGLSLAAPDSGGQGGKAEKPWNLIGRYVALRNEADHRNDPAIREKAGAVLEQIDDVLTNSATGEISEIISAARSYGEGIRQSVKGRVDNFKKLLPEYRRSPKFFMARYLAETRKKVLSLPNVVKHYIPTGRGMTEVYIGSDPEIARKIRMDKALEKKKAYDEKVKKKYSVTPP